MHFSARVCDDLSRTTARVLSSYPVVTPPTHTHTPPHPHTTDKIKANDVEEQHSGQMTGLAGKKAVVKKQKHCAGR